MNPKRSILLAALLASLLVAQEAPAQPRPVLGGADISALLEIEKAGGIFRTPDGKPGDEIAILHQHNCELFRVRLFVKPNPAFQATDGATQDLAAVTTLGKRIKAAGGKFMLDIHYSDTWADPAHQHKPAAWKDLPFDELEKKVETYTVEVIKELQAAGASPDMVQVGNEITSGILWPDARLSHGPKDKEPQQWKNFITLLKAGIRGVRACEKPTEKIPIILHIHGGGREKLPQWFFGELAKYGGKELDYDIIGLSFYPTWKDSLAHLKLNMDDLIRDYGKNIILTEVGYPFAPVDRIEGKETMEWPMTPEGQKGYLAATKQALAEAKDGKGMAYVWWYSDSINVPDKTLRIWRQGNEALFDHEGKPLPALSVFGSGK